MLNCIPAPHFQPKLAYWNLKFRKPKCFPSFKHTKVRTLHLLCIYVNVYFSGFYLFMGNLHDNVKWVWFFFLAFIANALQKFGILIWSFVGCDFLWWICSVF